MSIYYTFKRYRPPMGKLSISFLLGMLSMLALLLIANFLFDEETHDAEVFRTAYYQSYELHHSVMLNRLRIRQVINAENIDNNKRKALLNELWSIDNGIMVSKMALYLKTNESASPIFQINTDNGKDALERWVNLSSNKNEDIVDTQ